MSSITLSLVVPSVEIVFADDSAAVQSSVDADTVLGVQPGTVGLVVLAATTQAQAQAAIGVSSSSAVAGFVTSQVAAHQTAIDPHRQYTNQAQAILGAAFFGA